MMPLCFLLPPRLLFSGGDIMSIISILELEILNDHYNIDIGATLLLKTIVN